MKHKAILLEALTALDEFTARTGQPMDLDLQTTHNVVQGQHDKDRWFSVSTATVTSHGRQIFHKESTLETNESNEDKLCKEILFEMIFCSMDYMIAFYKQIDAKTAEREKKSGIITDIA